MSYQSPLLEGEGIPNHRHTLHQEAWEHKKNGRYVQADAIWQEMLDKEGAEMSTREYAATLQQRGVSNRGLWRLRRASKYFRSAITFAEKAGDPSLLRAIMLDYTAVLLDRFRPRRAIGKIESILHEMDATHPQYFQVQSYLGRSYGRLFGRKSRQNAQEYLSEALLFLNGEQRLDALVWKLEIPLRGHDRRADRDAALRLIEADDSLSDRAKDVHVTYAGFWPLRHAARWGFVMKQRLIG